MFSFNFQRAGYYCCESDNDEILSKVKSEEAIEGEGSERFKGVNKNGMVVIQKKKNYILGHFPCQFMWFVLCGKEKFTETVLSKLNIYLFLISVLLSIAWKLINEGSDL